MKTIRITLLIGLFPILFSPALCALPQIQHWQTANGARVYFAEATELPIVDIRISFEAGSARDGAQLGLASLTNEMMAQGADGLSTDQLLESLAGVGAEFGSHIGMDNAGFSLRSLSDPTLLQPALDTLVKILQKPDFPADAFVREQKRMLHSLEYDKQQPGTIASKAFYRAIYGNHPYATPEEGEEATVAALTPQDLRRFYERYYVAKNMIIAIVGAFDRPAAADIADALTQGLPAGEAAPPLPEVVPLQQAYVRHIEFPSTQTHVLLGQPSHSRYVPDYFTLFVGNHILGGSGLVSQLAEEVREKRGLSYSVYSYFSPQREAGPFLAGLQTRNDQAAQAVEVVRDTLRRFIEQGPTEEELTAAKQNLTGGFPLRIDSNRKLVSYVATIGFYGLPLDYLETWTAKVEAVTVEDIRKAFSNRLKLDKMALITVGDARVASRKLQASGRF